MTLTLSGKENESSLQSKRLLHSRNCCFLHAMRVGWIGYLMLWQCTMVPLARVLLNMFGGLLLFASVLNRRGWCAVFMIFAFVFRYGLQVDNECIGRDMHGIFNLQSLCKDTYFFRHNGINYYFLTHTNVKVAENQRILTRNSYQGRV